VGGFGLALRALLVAVFALSGTAKLRRLDLSRQAAQDLGVPASLAPAAGVVLPVVELAVAALLVLPASARAGAGLAAGLLTAFCVVIAANLARGRRPNCNCFGVASRDPIGATTLLRNGALLVAAATVWAADGASLPGPTLSGIETNQAILAGVLGVLVAAVLVQGWMILSLLRQHGRLLLRLDQLEASSGHSAPPAPASPKAASLPVGAPAPEFSLPGLHGETVTLAALRAAGRPVMLVFSDANCGPCTALMPDVAAWQREHASTLTIALVSGGDPAMNRAKAAEHGLANVLMEGGREVAEAYLYKGTPGSVLIDVRGRIAAPLVAGAPAIAAMVERVTAGIPVALGRRTDAHPHHHGHHKHRVGADAVMSLLDESMSTKGSRT
jgi:peroxiredoxin/uncharacterized membrane protein YphA (DoxX/SURF4 family)